MNIEYLDNLGRIRKLQGHKMFNGNEVVKGSDMNYYYYCWLFVKIYVKIERKQPPQQRLTTTKI